jgi:hypothetical protein
VLAKDRSESQANKNEQDAEFKKADIPNGGAARTCPSREFQELLAGARIYGQHDPSWQLQG